MRLSESHAAACAAACSLLTTLCTGGSSSGSSGTGVDGGSSGSSLVWQHGAALHGPLLGAVCSALRGLSVTDTSSLMTFSIGVGSAGGGGGWGGGGGSSSSDGGYLGGACALLVAAAEALLPTAPPAADADDPAAAVSGGRQPVRAPLGPMRLAGRLLTAWEQWLLPAFERWARVCVARGCVARDGRVVATGDGQPEPGRCADVASGAGAGAVAGV